MTDRKAAVLKALAYGMLQDRIKAGDDQNRVDLRREMPIGATEPAWGTLNGQDIELGAVQHKRGTKAETVASITDEDAFLEWAKTAHPEAVITETVTRTTISGWLPAEVVKNAVANGAAVDADGVAIPGVTVSEKPAGNPTIAVTRIKTDEAKAALIELVMSQGLDGFRSLLALEPAADDAS